MFRDILATLSMLVLASGALAAESELTGKTLIRGERITVGDLFTNAGRHSERFLAPTPKVGEKLVLSKNDLLRVAKAFNLDWKEPEDNVGVALERDAVAIDEKTLLAALEKSDLKEKISQDASFQLTNFYRPLVFDGQSVPEITVSQTAFDPASERFSAEITIHRDGEQVGQFTLKGNATPMMTIPVLRNSLAAGTVLSASDVMMLTLPKRDVRRDAVIAQSDIEGMVLKRMMSANQPIGKNDVTPPLLVKRNEVITVTYRNGPVNLSTKARAMANGAKGDIVMLQNLTSKKPFEAKITGPQQAEILINALDG